MQLSPPPRGGALLAAALLLPGVAPPAKAYDPPADRTVGVRHLAWSDGQPGLRRVSVASPSIWFVGPVAEDLSVSANLGVDAVSGASPRWHDAVTGASWFRDRRVAGDWRVTRHFDRSAWTVGVAHSDERDFRSRALSVAVRWRSEDGNLERTLGVAATRDRIDGVDPSPVVGTRRTVELLTGETRVLTPRDVVQWTATATLGDGLHDDPYKYPDRRPERRAQVALQAAWNHYVADGPAPFAGSTLRARWRVYRDDWGIRAHTVSAEWVRPLGGGWSVAPLARYHTQSAARFYFDPVYDRVLGPPFPPGFAADPGRAASADQRLSAFGAVALGLRVAWRIDDAWTADLRGEWYRQQSGWRLGGEGSPGLSRLDAIAVQVGISRRF